jgi:tRNA A37 threonylcarbamoyladenosine dehydratase
MNQFSRTQLLLGKEAMRSLAEARIAVFGIGGVGGYVCEALVRSGVGHFVLVDSDLVSFTNLNRQIIASLDTVGKPKVEVMAQRMRSINPDVEVEERRCFYLPENADSFDFSYYSYVVDAVDTVAAKIEIILRAQKAGIPVISSMGAGNHLDPESFHIADLYQTSMCPLAKVMRRELKKRGVEKLKVVYSTESPLTPCREFSEGEEQEELPPGKRSLPGSIAYAPSIAGLMIGAQVIRDLTGR